MLGRNDNRRETDGAAVFVFDGHLAFAVGTEPVDLAPLAALGEPVDDAMSKGDRHRHVFGRLIAGVAEHQPLVAGPVAINPHGNVAALAVQGQKHANRFGTKTQLVPGVADIGDDLADELGVVDFGAGRDFTGQNDQVGRA